MEIALAIASKVGEYLVKPTINQARYLFCFDSIVEDLKREEIKLESVHNRVKQQVKTAENNSELIEKDVEMWLNDACNILTDVQKLKKEIDVNKPCLHGWCPNWGWRYLLCRKAVKRIKIMLKLKDEGKFDSVANPAPLPGIEFSAPKDFELFQSSKAAFDCIIEALKNDKTYTVGLYGMGGAGKTTLAKEVGYKVKEEKIFNKVLMVVVSQTPNFKDIQGRLARSLHMTLEEGDEEERAKQLSLRFAKNEKILIILDDVWQKFDLKSKIGIPFDKDNKGCKILLTTRKQYVCTAMGCQSHIPLNLLNEDEGLALLKRHAGIDDDSLTVNALATEIGRECKGLPLAIVTIGSALKEKGVDEWKLVSQKLRKSKLVDIHNILDVDQDVYTSLKVSYDYLKDEETKLCFLLCSLFPEDHEIPLEELVQYGIGLGLYSDSDSIEEARSHLCVIVNNLKASSLLLDASNEDCVKMHDMVRDVALCIASKEKNVFIVKAGMGLTEWPKEEGLEQYTAISLIDNKINVLPNGLVCPKLEILLLNGLYRTQRMEVSDQCFEEMKAVKVFNLSYGSLSLKSLQFLTNLKTLKLISCELRDITSLKKLKRLEILSFEESSLSEFPKELGKLSKLRLLNLWGCQELNRISSSVISRFSQLEELYVTDIFEKWEVEGTSQERSNASLFELNSLSRLVILHLRIDATCLPEDFAFPKLLRYVICVNTFNYESYARTLKIKDIGQETSLAPFKALFHNLECLHLENSTIGCQNIVPSIDQGGLNKLKYLELTDCDEVEYVLDMTLQQVPSKAFSELVKLSLSNLILLREICNGGRLPMGFLEKLETINLSGCNNMCSLFPAVLILRLHKLKEVEIWYCNRLEEVFQLERLCHAGKENLVVLPSLEQLRLYELPALRCLWKGHVNLKSLTFIDVSYCNSLRYLFTLSLAQTLVQLKLLMVSGCDSLEHLIITDEGEEILSNVDNHFPSIFSKLEQLTIIDCKRLEYIFPTFIARNFEQLEEIILSNVPQLKYVFYLDNGREEGDGRGTLLPKLKALRLCEVANLNRLFPENFDSTWPALEVLEINSNLSMSFIDEVVAKVQDLKEKLRVLSVYTCNQLCDGILYLLKNGFKNLEELNIQNCGAKVILQLEGLDGQPPKLSLPNLKKLGLYNLTELEGLCRGPTHVLSMQNLTSLEVSHCHMLRHIFSPILARHLLQLKWLSIESCEELEQIIVEDDEGDQTSVNDHLQHPIFPNLSSVHVSSCNKLKCLFPINIAQGLQQLQELILYYNFQLVEVFGQNRDGAHVLCDKKIVLSQLWSLSIEASPNLTNFCTVGYQFIFPLLKNLKIKECPKIATRFSHAQNGSVHAEAKAPQISKEDGRVEFPPQPNVEMDYYDNIFAILPSYIEQRQGKCHLTESGRKIT